MQEKAEFRFICIGQMAYRVFSLFSPNHPCGRGWQVNATLPPQVQAIWMHVNIVPFWRMVLDNAIVFVPKHIFDSDHFIPIWRSHWKANADMLPSFTIGCDDIEIAALTMENWHSECTVVAMVFRACHSPTCDPIQFRYFEHSISCFLFRL
jgi:hypothetical protein